jgi:hypothetical protein
MLRIIGCTIEHVIGRSNRDIFQGIEPDEGNQEHDDKIAQEDVQNVYLLDIIDASGFHHTGSALSHKFPISTDASSTSYAQSSRSNCHTHPLTRPQTFTAAPWLKPLVRRHHRYSPEARTRVCALWYVACFPHCIFVTFCAGTVFTWFGFGPRRHHCRCCWRVFCTDHCSKKAMVCHPNWIKSSETPLFCTELPKSLMIRYQSTTRAVSPECAMHASHRSTGHFKHSLSLLQIPPPSHPASLFVTKSKPFLVHFQIARV